MQKFLFDYLFVIMLFNYNNRTEGGRKEFCLAISYSNHFTYFKRIYNGDKKVKLDGFSQIKN